MDGRSTWQSAADVPAAAVREYELHLAVAADRRKRRRGHSARPSLPEASGDDASFFDTAEPALQRQEDEVNPGRIDKCCAVTQRRYMAGSWLQPFRVAVSVPKCLWPMQSH